MACQASQPRTSTARPSSSSAARHRSFAGGSGSLQELRPPADSCPGHRGHGHRDRRRADRPAGGRRCAWPRRRSAPAGRSSPWRSTLSSDRPRSGQHRQRRSRRVSRRPGPDAAATRGRCLGCAPPLSAKPISSVAGRPARFPASFGAFGGKHGRRPPGSSSLASHVDLATGCWLDPGPFGCPRHGPRLRVNVVLDPSVACPRSLVLA